ncbi:MAG: SLC13 family permease [Nocardioidaceae bacterium]
MGGELGAVALLATVLGVAVVRPHGLPEAIVAVPAAGIVLVTGLVSTTAAAEEIERLWPVLVFLVAVFVLAQMCAAEGVFTAAGHWLAQSSDGNARRLLVRVFVICVVVTSVLSLDATAVLLTPVVAVTAARMQVSAAPHIYATGHLSNSASLLLPMGNLTNLLALAASGLTLVHFAGLMLVPWAVVIVIEYAVLTTAFRRELSGSVHSMPEEPLETPVFALVVMAVTLLGFVATSFLGVEPYWAAIAGAVALTAHALRRGSVRPLGVLTAMDLPFIAFVIGLTLVVQAVVSEGLGQWIDGRLPSGDGLASLLLLALTAAVLANVVNNLPALLILLPFVEGTGALAVLAVLIGVNVGPNLTYTGSLATLLWRRVAQDSGVQPTLARFTALGLATVPAGIVMGVLALWASAQVLPFA